MPPPFSAAEKTRLMQSGYKQRAQNNDVDLYIGLGIGTTELTTANGYDRAARARIPASEISVDPSTGVLTIAAGQTIYTANSDSAQDSTHIRLFRTADGGDAEAVTGWEGPHNNIAAPVNGQAVQTGVITITP